MPPDHLRVVRAPAVLPRPAIYKHGTLFLYAIMGARTTLRTTSIPHIWVAQGGELSVQVGGVTVSGQGIYVAPHVPHVLDGKGGVVHGLSLSDSLPNPNPLAAPVRALSSRELNQFTDYFDLHQQADAQDLAARLGLPSMRLSSGIQLLVAQMQATPQRRLNQLDAAALLRMERTALLKQFRQETGRTFRQYKARIGMQRAMELIGAGRSPSVAAMAGGFSDLSHFSRFCRASTGYSPRQGIHYLRQAAALLHR